MITVKVEATAVADALKQLQRRMSNLHPVMKGIGAELESRVKNRFETRTDPSGRPWAPWSAAYSAAYSKQKRTKGGKTQVGRGKILERYGDMLDEISWEADRDSARIGIGVPYAAYHEFGTRYMPRRGLMFEDPKQGRLSDEDWGWVTGYLQDWLNGKFDKP